MQGNGPAGYFSARQPGDLLQAQVQATWAAGQADADLVVWPENAMDEDPFRSSRAAAMLDTVSRELGAPVVFGAITERQGRFYNSSVLWQGGERTGAALSRRKLLTLRSQLLINGWT